MYLPYFRGKQYEIATIRELIPALRQSGKIVPIIEPIRAKATKKNPVGLASIEELAGSGIELILIVNPQKGALKTNHALLNNFLYGLLSPNLLAGFIVGPKTELREVREFLDRQTVRQVAIVHWEGSPKPEELAAMLASSQKVAYQIFLDGRSSTRYIHAFAGTGQPIILADGFQRGERKRIILR